MQFKKTLKPSEQYSIDELGRIRTTEPPIIALDMWIDMPTFDDAMSAIVKCNGSIGYVHPLLDFEDITSELRAKRYLDIEEGFCLGTGMYTSFGCLPFQWGEGYFFSVRPDYLFLHLCCNGKLLIINDAESEVRLAILSDYYIESTALEWAIQAQELDPLKLYTFEWWEKFWAVRGISALDRYKTDELDDEPAEKPLKDTERNTLLTIIAALAKEADYDISKISKTGELIASLTQQMGAPVGATTIERCLKKIPEAVKSRTK